MPMMIDISMMRQPPPGSSSPPKAWLESQKFLDSHNVTIPGGPPEPRDPPSWGSTNIGGGRGYSQSPRTFYNSSNTHDHPKRNQNSPYRGPVGYQRHGGGGHHSQFGGQKWPQKFDSLKSTTKDSAEIQLSHSNKK